MTQRVFKDIRIYEVLADEEKLITGDFSSINMLSESIYIAQRIARKLNEFNFSFGVFDHVYICFSPFLAEGELRLSDYTFDKKVKYIEVGLVVDVFNQLFETEKNRYIADAIFKVLHSLESEESEKSTIQHVQDLYAEYGRELRIHFKSKKTKNYAISIFYQIAPISRNSVGIIECHDLKNHRDYTKTFTLRFYDDIYSLIDSIIYKNGIVTLKPKCSIRAEVIIKDYDTPLIFYLEKQ